MDDEDVSPDLDILPPWADIRTVMEVSCPPATTTVSRDVISHAECSITSTTSSTGLFSNYTDPLYKYRIMGFVIERMKST